MMRLLDQQQQMKTNYQFSFNPDAKSIDNQEDISFTTLLKDTFPYLALQTVTFGLMALQMIWVILSVSEFSVIPNKEAENQERNIFVEMASNFVCLIFVGRVGSEYQSKIGSKYYLSVIVTLQIERFIFTSLISHQYNNRIIVNNSSLLSLYVLSLINLAKWKENQIPQYQSEDKTVQNYDLLDLNDTVIKLKPNESQFMYESYTNKQFYFHNVVNRDDKVQKNAGKLGKKMKKSSKFIEDVVSEGENYQLKIFKMALLHFIAFSTYPAKEFAIFILTEITVYLLFVTKALKKLAFT